MDGEPAIILQLLPLPAALLGALITPKYLWACLWSAVFYVVGKVALDMANMNPDGLASGAAFSSGWYGNLLGQLALVWILTALFYRMTRKMHSRVGQK